MASQKRKSIWVLFFLILAFMALWYSPIVEPLKKTWHDSQETSRWIEILKQDQPPVPSFRTAASQLADRQNPKALDLLIQKKDHTQVSIRTIVAQSLGKYSGHSALEALRFLTRDKSKEVRAQAIRSLADGNFPQAKEVLQPLIENPTHADIELYEAWIQLNPQSTDPLVEQSIRTLVDFSAQGDSSERNRTSTALLAYAPKHPKTIELMRSKLLSSRDAAFKARILRSLRALDAQWLKKNLSSLKEERDPVVQMEILRSVVKLCPDDRWEIWTSIFSRPYKKLVLDAALLEIQSLRGPQALKWIQEFQKKADPPLTPTSLHRVKAAEKALSRSTRKNRCIEK